MKKLVIGLIGVDPCPSDQSDQHGFIAADGIITIFRPNVATPCTIGKGVKIGFPAIYNFCSRKG